MDEQLLAYLRNTLDPAARRAFETYLQAHPDAAARLQRLQAALAPWEDGPELNTPADLVHRTLAHVAAHQPRPLPQAPRPSPWQLGSSPTRRFRLPDVAVAAAIFLLLGGLAVAWLPYARARANDLACQNQMRVVWHALERYGEEPDHHGAFPQVQPRGAGSVAGAFAPMLQDAGLLTPDVSLVCTASGEPVAFRPSMHELEQLYVEQPEAFKTVARTLAGTYAYSLGYRDADGNLTGLRLDSGDRLPLLADAPPTSGFGLSPNHGCRGQNVLYIGGNVRFCTHRLVGINGDDIYLNQDGELRTGRNWGDTVLAPSAATPFGASE